MTITYTAEVATCKKFGCFIKLLGRWKGSIYKLVWMDLLLFLFLYYSINLIYLYLLDTDSKKAFESVVYYCASYSSLIPLSFVLGFYVNLVMARWWEQYITIPWPDSVAVYVSAHVHGQDERGRVMRRTVMRYVCLCLTMVFTMISPCVKKRFPKLKNLVEAGFLLENEKKIIESMDIAFPKYPKHWLPIIWAASVITRARKEGLIRDDFAVKTIIDELNHFRGRCGILMYYDFISIPLVYTQVVTIAVYSFCVCSLLAHQWTEFKKDTYEGLDFYMPLFIMLQFFFYMGWLKVAETLINPFGEDDDDFEVNWMIDRNLQVSYLIVDEMHHEHPELVKDQYWDEVYPSELPYDSEVTREHPPQPSTAKYDVSESSELSIVNISNSTKGNSKPRLESLLSLRSELFNAAFQRFTQYLEEKEQNKETFADSLSMANSLSDIESVENVTSYRTTLSHEEEFADFKSDYKALKAIVLESISEKEDFEIEEEEKTMVADDVELVEEENTMLEEEVCQRDQNHALPESDNTNSESDPFERLRLERQQERIERTHKFLQKYFGTSNFRLIKPNMPYAITGAKINQKTQSSSVLEAKTKLWDETKKASAATSFNSQSSIESNLKRIINNLPLSSGVSPDIKEQNVASDATFLQIPGHSSTYLLFPSHFDQSSSSDMIHRLSSKPPQMDADTSPMESLATSGSYEESSELQSDEKPKH
uniref:Bestrophin homolog n=1 Tax=Stomoxys calcitrans TaxID=35570 RepID=A0A1I8NXE4_STOCA